MLNKERSRVLWNVCIICNKKNCHYSYHIEQVRRVFRNFSRAYFGDDVEEDRRKNYEDADEERNDKDGESFFASARATVAMGLLPKSDRFVIDAALIDTGSCTLSTEGHDLLPASKMASVRKKNHVMGGKGRKIGGIGADN